MSQQSSIIRAGDLLVAPAFADTETTLYQLPDGTPLQPLKVPQQRSNGQFAGWPVSTLGASDIYAAVCNGSTATAHTVQGARVKLAGFTAYSGQLSAWDYCAGYYARPAGVTPNNCDRGTAPTDEMLQAAFASDAPVGTIVAATQSAPPAEGFGPLPAVLPPGSVMYLHLGLTARRAGHLCLRGLDHRGRRAASLHRRRVAAARPYRPQLERSGLHLVGHAGAASARDQPAHALYLPYLVNGAGPFHRFSGGWRRLATGVH